MKTPDKIFFPNDINLLTKLSLVIKQKDDVCYIRKDVLLEWAKERLDFACALNSEGQKTVCEELIEKLNSI